MELISKNFNIFLNNNYNYDFFLENLRSSYNYYFNKIKNGNNIPSDFDSIKNKYNIYYKYILNLKNYNIKKIREISFITDYDNIKLDMNTNLIYLKKIIDNYPYKLYELLNEVNFQKVYYDNINDVYPSKELVFSSLSPNKYNNFFYNLIGDVYYYDNANNIEGKQFLPQFINLCFLSSILFRVTNLQLALTDNILNSGNYMNNILEDEFLNYLNSTNTNDISIKYVVDNIEDKLIDNLTNKLYVIDDYKQNKFIYSYNFFKIISRYIYNILSSSNNLKELIIPKIISNFNKIPSLLSKYILDRGENVAFSIYTNVLNVFENKISLYLHNKIISSDIFPIHKFIITMESEELSIITNRLNNINEFNLKSYIMLSYYYKTYPLKFINILSLIIKQYVEDNLYELNQEYFDLSYISTKMQTLNNQEYFKLIKNNINDIVNINTDNFSNFALYKYILDIIDKFIESDLFTNFIFEMLEEINNEFIKFDYINKEYNYLKNINVIKLFFKAWFKSELLNNNMFLMTINNLNNDINNVISDLTINYSEDLTKEMYTGFYLSNTNIKNIYNFTNSFYLSSITKQIFFDMLNYYSLDIS